MRSPRIKEGGAGYYHLPLATVAAYIDLNPVRAGLVKDPKDYRFSSYGAAVAGGRAAQAGICHTVASLGETPTWTDAAAIRQRSLPSPSRVFQPGATNRRPTDDRRMGIWPVPDTLPFKIRLVPRHKRQPPRSPRADGLVPSLPLSLLVP